MRGIFITGEGPEGAGKTSILNKLAEDFTAKGYPIVLTREPGGIRIAEQIREIILNKENTEMDARTEALLYAAARRQHLAEKVKPALEKGAIVLCDRFIDSSLAYQGYARGLGIDEVYEMNLFATQDMMPDATLYFDITPEEGLKRIERNRGREVNRLDLEALDFHQKVYEGYQLLLNKFSGRMHTIDASASFDEVYHEAAAKLDSLLEMRE